MEIYESEVKVYTSQEVAEKLRIDHDLLIEYLEENLFYGTYHNNQWTITGSQIKASQDINFLV